MVYICSVVGCKGNYPGHEKLSVFRFPKDADLGKKWIKNLPLSKRTPNQNCRVCIKHFQPEDILRESSMYDEKTERQVTVKLTHPRLRTGAIPIPLPKKTKTPVQRRSTKSKRKIKKPKMEQFVTFSDSEMEDLDDEKTHEETPDSSQNKSFLVVSVSSPGTVSASSDESCLQIKQEVTFREAIVSSDHWPSSDHNEITIEETKLQEYMETQDGGALRQELEKTEDAENEMVELYQNPNVGSSSDGAGCILNTFSIVEEYGREINTEQLDNEAANNVSCSFGNQSFLLLDYNMECTQKKIKSPVWKHYKLNEGENATCNYCSENIKTPNGSTLFLARHHLSHIRENKSSHELIELTNELEKGKEVSVSKNSVDITDIERTNILNEKIAIFLAKEYIPLSILDREPFQQLVNELNPEYKIPPTSVFAENILPKLSDDLLEKVKLNLIPSLENISSFSLTVDTWTLRDGVDYISLAYHYITEKFVMKSHFLGTQPFYGKQSGAEIFKEIECFLEKRGLENANKIVHIVTEKSRYIENFQKRNWVLLPCFAYKLKLAINEAKAKNNDFINLRGKCRNLYFRYHSAIKKKKHSMKEIEINDEIKFWDGETEIFSNLLDMQELIQKEQETEIDSLSDEEWKVVKAISEILKPIEEALKDFCKDHYPPLSMTIPIIYGIEHMLNKVIKKGGKGSQFTKDLLNAMKEGFPSYKMNKPSLLAMMTDPRYKAVILSDMELSLAINIFVNEIMHDLSTENDTSSNEGVIEEKEEEELSSSLWSAFRSRTKEHRVPTERDLATCQLKHYLDQNVIPMDNDPFKWWSENKEKYNLLVPVVQKYLSIPATQVSSRLLTSKEEFEMANRRIHLDQSIVDKMVFIHENSASLG